MAKATELDSWRRSKSKVANSMVKDTAKTAKQSRKTIIHSPPSRLVVEVALRELGVVDGKLRFFTWISWILC